MSKTYNAVAIPAEGKPIQAIDLPIPGVHKDEVQVKVEYAGVNHVDKSQAETGAYVSKWPFTVGVEFAGTVTAIGEGVTDVEVGQKVAGVSYAIGSYAQFVTVKRTMLTPIPSSSTLSLSQLSKVPHTFLTAFWTLFGPQYTNLSLTPSKEESETPLLIWAASTSVGVYALQILKRTGYVNVLAVASKAHFQRLKALGAKAVFDRGDSDVAKQIKKELGGTPLKKALVYMGDKQGGKDLFQVLDSKEAHVVPIIRATPSSIPKHVKWTRAVVFDLVNVR
ncbi:GroES-like protein [Atractiella rhizophila]|nr:GroES-like protein [Atractiella rhizophila]